MQGLCALQALALILQAGNTYLLRRRLLLCLCAGWETTEPTLSGGLLLFPKKYLEFLRLFHRQRLKFFKLFDQSRGFYLLGPKILKKVYKFLKNSLFCHFLESFLLTVKGREKGQRIKVRE